MNLGGIDLSAYMKATGVKSTPAVQHANLGKIPVYNTGKMASKPTTTTVFGPAPSPPSTVKALVWSSPEWYGEKIDTVYDADIRYLPIDQLQVLEDLVRAGKWVRDSSLPGYREAKYTSCPTHDPSKTLTVKDLLATVPVVSPIRSPSPTPPPWTSTTVTASPAPTTPTTHTKPAKAGGVRQNWSKHVPADLTSDKIPPLVREVFPFPAEALKPYPLPENMAVRFHYEGKTSSGATYSYTCAIHQSVLKYVFVMSDPALDVEVHFVEDCPVALGYRILFWLQEK